MSRTTTISRLPTDRLDYLVRTSVWYAEPSRSRGYYASINLIKVDGPMEMSRLFGPGNKQVLLLTAKRFNQREFDSIIEQVKLNKIPEVVEAQVAVLELAPAINF